MITNIFNSSSKFSNLQQCRVRLDVSETAAVDGDFASFSSSSSRNGFSADPGNFKMTDASREKGVSMSSLETTKASS